MPSARGAFASQPKIPQAELENVCTHVLGLLRRAASRVQAASRSPSAALIFKEKAVFSLKTPGAGLIELVLTQSESRPSRGADNDYDMTLGRRLG